MIDLAQMLRDRATEHGGDKLLEEAAAALEAAREDGERLDWFDANWFSAYRQCDPIDGLSKHCVLVVFDPPHLVQAGARSWLASKYGRLGPDWREDLRTGFAECFRVLRPEGVLIFKWSEVQVPLRDVLALTPQRPLFGHPSGKRAGTHWITFMKHPTPTEAADREP